MHTAQQLAADLFAVRADGRDSTREEVLPGWHELDRLGVVVTEPFGALGASHLIQLSITAFYDAKPVRRSGFPMRLGEENDLQVYPEIYLFHVGGRHGDHSVFDFWPARKEVFLPADPRAVLDAINDRAITRLLVPDLPPSPVVHEWKEPAAARDRIKTAYAYGPGGRTEDADIEILGLSGRTEFNPKAVLEPDRRYSAGADIDGDAADPDLHARSWSVRTAARLHEAEDGLEEARRKREEIRGPDGFATETYRRVTVDEALSMFVGGAAKQSPASIDRSVNQ